MNVIKVNFKKNREFWAPLRAGDAVIVVCILSLLVLGLALIV